MMLLSGLFPIFYRPQPVLADCYPVFPEEFLRAVRHDVMTLRKNEDILVYDLLVPSIRYG